MFSSASLPVSASCIPLPPLIYNTPSRTATLMASTPVALRVDSASWNCAFWCPPKSVKLGFPNDILAIEATNEIKSLVAIVVQLFACKAHELSITGIEDGIVFCGDEFIHLHWSNAQCFRIDPATEQWADLPIGFFWFRAALVEFTESHFIEASRQSSDSCRVARNGPSITLQIGNVGILDWK